MIPKVIHYCWFGRNPKPKLAEKCIKSWKKYCPDYEIIEWNEDNFDISACPLYVRQAYEAKKWAFVTDYVRLWVLTQYGGVYMDTDVELRKPIDRFLSHEAFSGFESENQVPTGIMASRKDFPLFLEFLQFYDDASFLKPDGSFNLVTNVEIMTRICKAHGLKLNNSFQIMDGFALYPTDVFCPLSYNTGWLNKTKNTVSIHWFSASWQTKEQRKRYALYMEEMRKIRFRGKVNDLLHFPHRIILKMLGENNYIKLKSFLGKG